MAAAHNHRIDSLGRRQLGLVTFAQLGEFGFGRGAVDRGLRSGRLVRVRRGVYRLPGHQPTWESAVLAALLAAGDDAVASHLTASRIWWLEPDRKDADQPDAIHLSSPRELDLPGVVAHKRTLPPAQRARSGAIPVTSVARTLLDLAACFDAERLGRCVDEALRRRIVTLEEIRGIYDAARGPGRRRLIPIRDVLSHRVPGFDPGANDWERRMDDGWDDMGLPRAARQYEIRCGNRFYRVDRAIVELRLAVEWVGCEYHAQAGRFRRDRRRISDLALAGWDVIEVTSDWTRDRIKRTVLAKVEQRRRTENARQERQSG